MFLISDQKSISLKNSLINVQWLLSDSSGHRARTAKRDQGQAIGFLSSLHLRVDIHGLYNALAISFVNV